MKYTWWLTAESKSACPICGKHHPLLTIRRQGTKKAALRQNPPTITVAK